MTRVRRIDMAQSQNLENDIQQECENMQAAGYVLASTFTYQSQLVLIFQQ